MGGAARSFFQARQFFRPRKAGPLPQSAVATTTPLRRAGGRWARQLGAHLWTGPATGGLISAAVWIRAGGPLYRLCLAAGNGDTPAAAPIRCCGCAQLQRGQKMKLIIGKPDETEVVLAEQVNGAWKPNPNIASEMATFLQGADPEQFEMWVEEPD